MTQTSGVREAGPGPHELGCLFRPWPGPIELFYLSRTGVATPVNRTDTWQPLERSSRMLRDPPSSIIAAGPIPDRDWPGPRRSRQTGVTATDQGRGRSVLSLSAAELEDMIG
ncbi:hypothetical protein NL676_035024 [Syzygium grande]|nr:hypothetical protein NL676_035024 [Syzygium grande]